MWLCPCVGDFYVLVSLPILSRNLRFMKRQGSRGQTARIIPERGEEAVSGPLSWFSLPGLSSDMGTIECLERGMSQLEKINLHM